MRGSYRRSTAALVALALGIAGCSPAPTASPAPAATLTALPSAVSSPSAPAPATAPPSPSAPPAPSPAVADAWTWTAVDGSVFGALAPDLAVALPDGRTLTITNPYPDETTRPALWTSADGLAWERVPDPGAFRPRASGCWVSVADVKPTADGLAAVGLESCSSTLRATGRAWTSPDGVVWTAASVSGAAGGSIEEVVPTADGLVGLGRSRVEVPDGAGWQDRSRPAEWTSPDGQSWRLVKHPDRTPVRGVVAFGGAYYGLAWFEDRLNASGDIIEDPRSGVWTSSDALRWRHVAAAPTWAVLAPRAGLLVAVGRNLDSASLEPTAWVSADGAAWAGTRLPDPALPPGAVSPDDDPSLVDVRPDSLIGLPRGGGLLALGSRDANSGSSAVAWTSPDGRSWSALPLPFGPHFLLEAALPVASRVLLQGTYQEDLGSTDTVVVGTPPMP